MLHGSCCCGAVKIEVAEPPSMLATCHCSRCRKLGSKEFVFVKRSAVTIVEGAAFIETLKPAATYRYNRSFCSRCGTSLGELDSESETFPINAHILDDPLDLRNRFHEFVSEKPGWYDISDDAKQFDTHPVAPS